MSPDVLILLGLFSFDQSDPKYIFKSNHPVKNLKSSFRLQIKPN